MNAQIAIETMLALGIILLVLATVSVFTLHNNIVVDAIDNEWEDLVLCQQAASVISNIYAAGNGSSWSATMNKCIFAYEDGSVILQDMNTETGCLQTPGSAAALCSHFGRIREDSIVGGDFVIENVDGNVVVRSA